MSCSASHPGTSYTHHLFGHKPWTYLFPRSSFLSADMLLDVHLQCVRRFAKELCLAGEGGNHVEVQILNTCSPSCWMRTEILIITFMAFLGLALIREPLPN